MNPRPGFCRPLPEPLGYAAGTGQRTGSAPVGDARSRGGYAGTVPRVKRSLTVALLAAGLLAACSSNGSTVTGPTSTTAAAATTTTTQPGKVTRLVVTFVDRSRATVDPNHTRSAPTRTLPTYIWVPSGPGPFPLIVHAHGSDGYPTKFTQLFGVWARHHYLVAAPAFPLSNNRSGGPTVVSDYQNQALDMRFVIRRLLARSAAPGNPLSGKIDPTRVGVSGLSLGGATTYGVAFNTCCRESHIKAAIIMSGIKLPFGDHPYHFAGTPVLIFHGTADPLIPYASAGPRTRPRPRRSSSSR